MSERITQNAVISALARHIGSENGATAAELVGEITHRAPDEHETRQLRHIVEALRRNGHHVCAHPNTGYFIARTPEELDRTCEYLFGRAMCSLSQIAAMKRVSLPDLRGQLHLPD